MINTATTNGSRRRPKAAALLLIVSIGLAAVSQNQAASAEAYEILHRAGLEATACPSDFWGNQYDDRMLDPIQVCFPTELEAKSALEQAMLSMGWPLDTFGWIGIKNQEGESRVWLVRDPSSLQVKKVAIAVVSTDPTRLSALSVDIASVDIAGN